MSDESADDELERELRQLAARLDPVPPELVQAAAEALSWRNIDAELAELAFDSLLSTDEAALVRSSPGRRLVSFQTPELTIDVEVTATASGRDVMGQITPPQRATVEIRHRAGVVSTEADERGSFRSASLQTGPMSLRLHPAAGGRRPPIVTDWLSI
jgi:hypothetical protein